MSSNDSPPPENEIEVHDAASAHPLEQQPKSRWFTLIAVLVLGLVVATVFGGRTMYRASVNAWGRHLVKRASAEMKDEKWESAARVVGDAMKTAPEEPEVLRKAAEFLRKTNGDPEMTRFFLQKLYDSKDGTSEDTIMLGQTLITTGDTPRARRIYNDLPTDVKNKRKGMELLAKILDDEGQKQAAMATLRQALMTEPDDNECMLRLAMLDLDQPFNETRRNAQETIWRIARGQDDTALQAIGFLTLSKELTPGEAETLLKTVSAHPKSNDRHRFMVLSAYMRLFPTKREDVLDAECAKYKDKTIDDSIHFYRWLNQEHQSARLLGLIPKSLVLKSADAFPAYADALMALGRHAELKTLIQGSPPPPLSQANAHAYLASCYGKLEPNLLQAKQEIENAYRAVMKSGEHQVALRCAELAEKQGLWDLASKGYEMIGANNGRVRIAMLTKVYEMASLAKDGARMLDAASRISKARPDSWLFQARADYLRLVLGSGFEGACDVVISTNPAANAITRTPENSSYLAILRALAFYRMGDTANIATELQRVTAPDSLPPGLRAVMVGLMKISNGDAATAFRMAEAVPPSILLPEELRFLKMAL